MPDDRDPITDERILGLGRRVLRIEGDAVLAAGRSVDGSFCRLVRAMLDMTGKVVLTGVGKSGIVAMKIAATLASTGTPAFFLKPLDAVHGDLGMVAPGDLLLALSHSGETQEILNVIVAAKALRARIAAITGDATSTLAREADIVLCVAVEREACPLGLAPTTSTTVAAAIGDAIAMTLSELRGFSREDYARYHPGGSLGRRLSHRVGDFMRTGDLLPLVRDTDSLRQAIRTMTEKERLGVTLVRDEAGILAGILTDGDLRRILERDSDPGTVLDRPVRDFMTRGPKTVEPDALASEALRIMEVKGITSLAIVAADGKPAGIVHLHDILGRGTFFV
jgi:arabinose-5-phosphate isomerase